MYFMCAGLFILTLTLPSTSGQTIDEVIAGAVTSMDGMDMLANLEGSVIRQELDMMLTLEQYRDLKGMSEGGRKKRKAVKSERYRWTDKTVKYVINNNVFSARDKGEITQAINEWQTHTCIKFRRKTSNDKNYVQFDNGNGCYSYVGMTGGKQTLGLAGGCRYKGVIVHEIGHAIGFHHEQNRPDRDDFVKIRFDNIPTSVAYNFKKYSYSAVDNNNVPYDYTSIMHYGGRAFSNNGGYTIQTVDPANQHLIGNRQGLSYHDIMMANRIYYCDATCNGRNLCGENAYRGKDCKCYCKGPTKSSPTKECDGTESVTTRKPDVTTKSSMTTTTVKPECKDENENCPTWAEAPDKYCERNQYVRTYCRKSCGRCDGDGAEKTRCMNKKQHCYAWKKLGYCTKDIFSDYLKANCPKACGHCTPSNDDDMADHYGEGPDVDGGASAQVERNLALLGGALIMSAYHILR